MKTREVKPELSTVPRSCPWLTGPLATTVVFGVVLAVVCQHERTRRYLAEDRMDSVLRLEDYTYAISNTPVTPDKSRLEKSTRCAVAAIELAQAYPDDATVARLIYRLAGELYFVVGIRGSSPIDLVNAYDCLRQVYTRGGTEDSGAAMRFVVVLHEIGVRLANSQFDHEAFSCFQLAMQIVESHIKQGGSRSFLSAYGRSYDAFANLCGKDAIIGDGSFRVSAVDGLGDAVDLWMQLRDEEPDSSSYRLGLATSHFNYALFLQRLGQENESSSHLTHVVENLKPFSEESSYKEILLHVQAIAFRAVLHQRESGLVDTTMAELQSSLQLLRSTRDMSAPAFVADLRKLARNLHENGMKDEAAAILSECISVLEEHSNSFDTVTRERMIDEIESQRSGT